MYGLHRRADSYYQAKTLQSQAVQERIRRDELQHEQEIATVHQVRTAELEANPELQAANLTEQRLHTLVESAAVKLKTDAGDRW